MTHKDKKLRFILQYLKLELELKGQRYGFDLRLPILNL